MSFRSCREAAGFPSQKVVAEKLGVDQSSVCYWELGKTAPRASLLPKIAALYGCTIDDLFRPDEAPETA